MSRLFDEFSRADRSELERVPVNPWDEVIADFKASGEDCVSRTYTDKDRNRFNSDVNKARSAAQRAGGVKVRQRGSKMYLVRED